MNRQLNVQSYSHYVSDNSRSNVYLPPGTRFMKAVNRPGTSDLDLLFLVPQYPDFAAQQEQFEFRTECLWGGRVLDIDDDCERIVDTFFVGGYFDPFILIERRF